MTHLQRSTIAEVIAALYKEAAAPPPSVKRCVAPLNALMGGYQLNCSELDNLTSQTAMHFLLRCGGLVEPPEDVNQEPLAGFLYASPNFGSIFVERTDLVVRRRFSAAHELGHYLLHFRPLFMTEEFEDELALHGATDAFLRFELEVEPDELPTGQITLPPMDDATRLATSFEQMEREANQFAAELLMPEGIVRELATQYTPHFRGEDLVRRLATDMLVSRAAMRWRLRNLGLLSSKDEWN